MNSRERTTRGILNGAVVLEKPVCSKANAMAFRNNENKGKIRAYSTKKLRRKDEELGYVCSTRVASAKRKTEENKRKEELNIKARREAKYLLNGKNISERSYNEVSEKNMEL